MLSSVVSNDAIWDSAPCELQQAVWNDEVQMKTKKEEEERDVKFAKKEIGREKTLNENREEEKMVLSLVK